jgi:hypothetical protein
MGIGFVLVIWAVAGVIVAVIGMPVLGGITAYVTRGVKQGRRTAVIAAALFPAACLGWAGTVFVFQWAVNQGLLRRDPDLGDVLTCPLPNGYQLLMTDVTDRGYVYNPKTQRFKDSVLEQEDAVSKVRVVQVAGRYILGAMGRSRPIKPVPNEGGDPDSYFVLDTRTGKRETFSTYDALRRAAGQFGVDVHLQPIEAVYLKYRFTLFDLLAAFLLFAPPLLSAWLLVRWIVRLRRNRILTSEPT